MTSYAELMRKQSILLMTALLSVSLLAAGCGDDDDDDDNNRPADTGVTDVDDGEDVGVDDAGDVAEDVVEDADEDVAAGTASVQVIHASPDDAASPVDVYVNDELLLDNFEYLSATPFVPVASGQDLVVDVTASDAADNSNPVYSQTIPGSALVADGTFVAIASGVIGDNFEIRVSGAEQGAPSGESAVQIFHGVPDAPAVDVTAGDGAVTLAEGLEFGNFSDISTVDAADVTAEVALAGTTTPVASFVVPLSGFDGEYVTVVARGTIDTTDDAAFGATAFSADGTSTDLAEPSQ